MDKRRKHIDPDVERELRQRFYQDIRAGRLSLAEAVKTMRRISRLTQAEFARHRNIGLAVLKQIEAGKGNPRIETLNKIGEIFGLEAGLIYRAPPAEKPPFTENR